MSDRSTSRQTRCDGRGLVFRKSEARLPSRSRREPLARSRKENHQEHRYHQTTDGPTIPTRGYDSFVVVSSSRVIRRSAHRSARGVRSSRRGGVRAGRARCYAARCPSPRRSPRCPTRWHGGRVLCVPRHGAAALLATADTSRRSRRGRGRRARPLEGDASASRRSRRSVRVRRGARSRVSRALPATTTQGARRLIRARRHPRRRRWTTPRPGPAAW